ncbi:hypothetical protein F5Y08DRAFT_318577 [Xylaria arbuscula]|nr:hypothetical protein F5Y08DRAFT_318577 [Xylaria arbuscula]
MSASASSPAPPDITCLTPEPFAPKPLIADILRTRYCVTDSIFLVEGVDVFHTSKSKRWRAIRLLLGDGELCIQALMAPETHRFVDRGEVVFGVYVKLESFRVEWRDVESEDPASAEGRETDGDRSVNSGPAQSDEKKKKKKSGRQMVYLIVDGLEIVGWHNSLIDSSMTGNEEADLEAVGAESEKLEESQEARPNSPELETAQQSHKTANSARPQPEDDSEYAGIDIDIDDGFEVMQVPEDKATQNREAIASAIPSDQPPPPHPSHHDHFTQPLKLTKLRSIPNLPFKQNWSVNVLCVVSAISDVEPAGIPPFTQRQARLTDPSTDKHVLVTVFLDAHLFTPRVGSVVLLCGVKNHRFDGGSLKKYDSDRPKSGGTWWCEDPSQLSWCDVDGLRQWWAGGSEG